jgi:hypothetical protein
MENRCQSIQMASHRLSAVRSQQLYTNVFHAALHERAPLSEVYVVDSDVPD